MTTMTVEIPQSLLDQQTTLTATVATIIAEQDALAAKKLEAETSLARIDRAIRFLKGEEIPAEKPAGSNGPRKQMSEEGKANIRAGLIAAAARKAAAKAAAAAPPVVAEPVASVPAAAPTPEAPKAAKKGGK